MNREMVLYYTPENTPNAAKLKGVLVRMGVRIKNISPEQTGQTIGYLAGLAGFKETDSPEAENEVPENAGTDAAVCFGQAAGAQSAARNLPARHIPCEILVMHNFTSRRIDELLLNLRRAGVPRIALKAVVTEHNSRWTFYHLYEEIKKEHEAMTPSAGRAE